MSKQVNTRLNDAELAHIKEQAIKLGVPQTEIIRQAIWRDAAVAEIRDQTKAAVQKEFDLLFAKLAVEFAGEVEKMSVEVETMRQEFASTLTGLRDEILKTMLETHAASKESLRLTGKLLFEEISKTK